MTFSKAFGVPRRRRSGKPNPPAKDATQRVSSWTFEDGALAHAARDSSPVVCAGNAVLNPSRVGDIARSVMGAVLR